MTRFCITPLPYNKSLHPWEMIKRHIQGAIHQNITMDIDVLQRLVPFMSQQTATFDTQIKDWDKFADAIEQLNPFVYLKAHFWFCIGAGVLILFFI